MFFEGEKSAVERVKQGAEVWVSEGTQDAFPNRFQGFSFL
jgi:hypothetical protein